ncbi:basement membrane-specific heparan sulfate proteoglycan core protein-like [Engraulis encrasicolus]|uniref:basement membrane-specific heparan sulfate proteoglycan core protein-like n=1 Tax=Engraulis encrasicolus TaxID=184585 RepID=UPI002FD511B0
MKGKPTPVLRSDRHTPVFTGNPVTLTCQLMTQSTGWRFYWYRRAQFSASVAQTDGNSYSISSAKVSDGGQYWCRAGRGDPVYFTQYSNAVWVNVTEGPKAVVTLLNNWPDIFSGEIITLQCDIQGKQLEAWNYKKPRPVISGSAQSWLTEGDSVTLSCEVSGSSAGWTFHWYKTAPYRPGLEHVFNENRGYCVEFLPDRGRGAGGSYTLSPAALRHTGVYMCRAERGEPPFQTEFSQLQPLWVTGSFPSSVLVVVPNTTQHFDLTPLSLSCEGTGNSTLRWFSQRGEYRECPSGWTGAETTCSTSSASPSDSGVYWCQSESGEQSNPVNITVHPGNVILESPVHPVTEGDPLTLRCRYRYQPSNISADFYKDGTLLHTSSTGEMTIPAVSKSHEGLYKCSNPKKGESPESQVIVRGTCSVFNVTSICLTSGLVVGVMVIVVLGTVLLLLYFYRKRRAGRDTQIPLSDSYSYPDCSPPESCVHWRDSHYDVSDRFCDDPPTPKVTILSPEAPFYEGDKVTVSCDISEQGTWDQYIWHLIPTVTLSAVPQSPVFIGETVTMTCLIDSVMVPGLERKPTPLLRSDRHTPVLTGNPVTLTCHMVPQSTGWRFYWYRHAQISVLVAPTDGNSYSIRSAKVSDGGQYWCRAGRGDPVYYTHYSNAIWVNVTEAPKAVVTLLNRWPDIFSGEIITLACDIQGKQLEAWNYSWYKDGRQINKVQSSSENKIKFISESGSGDYNCRGTRSKDSQTSEISGAIKVAVLEKPRPVISGPAQSWLTEGDSVTLSCEVSGSSTGWTFHWYKTAPYRSGLEHVFLENKGYDIELLPDSSRGAGGSYTLSPAALRHTGVYVCRAERGEPPFQTEFSQLQPLWVTGSFPSSVLVVVPNTTQLFDWTLLSLSCEGTGNSTGWRLRWFSQRGEYGECPSGWTGAGTTCSTRSVYSTDSGVYWCQSESGEQSNPVNITVHSGNVILESPVHPVTEGDPLTLRCRYRHQPSDISADFYKDGTLLNTSSTGEMTIPAVSKSHEGLYKCSNPERGESPESQVIVRGSLRVQCLVVGVMVIFVLGAVLLLLYFYRKRKGCVNVSVHRRAKVHMLSD